MDCLNDSADIFANSSTETVTENLVKSPQPECSQANDDNHPNKMKLCEPLYASSPIVASPRFHGDDSSFLVNQFISEECNMPARIYCPFCPLDYGFEFLLKEHIKAIHSQELKGILRAKQGDIKLYPCSFCHAKFYVKELLPRHILRKHEKNIVDLFSGDVPDEYLECKFCPHKVMRKHHKLLLVHIEKKHFEQFEQYVFKKYSNVEMSCEDLINLDSDAKLTNQIITPSYCANYVEDWAEDRVIYSRKPIIIKPILKASSCYDITEEISPVEKFPFESENSPMENDVEEDPVVNARRKLRFNLPDSPGSSENWDPKLVGAFKRKKSKWSRIFSKSKKSGKENNDLATKISPKKTTMTKAKKVSSPMKVKNSDNLPLRFMCGLCMDKFENNHQLLDHLKQKHRGLKLQAQYRCGECEAKFYKNSFLVRHCWHHHTPLCLRSPENDA